MSRWGMCVPLLLCLLSSSARGGSPRALLNQVERLLAQWQVAEAEVALEPLIHQSADNPRVVQLQAEIRFLKGEYASALELAQEAVRRNRSTPRAKALRNLIVATQEVVKGYVEHRSASGRFRVWTAPGKDELLAPFANQTLEAIQKELQQNLGYSLAGTLRVEVYPSPEALARVSPLTLEEIRRSGTIALCKYNRLMIVTPRALLRGYPWLDTLAHEYAHLVVARMSRDHAPVWLQEGLAKFFEAAWRLPAGTSPPLSPVQEHLLAEALAKNQLLRWEQMHPSLAKLPNQRATALAFAQVQTAIDFISRRAGAAGLRQMIAALQNGKQDWLAIFQVTKLEREAFQTAWKKHLRSLNLRRLSGLIPQELVFGKPQSEERRIVELKEGRARRYLRLAEMLRSHGLTRAAILEYQKARLQLGPRDELVANHLARAYLEISSPAQAISALMPVLEYYPDFPGPQVTMGIAYLRAGDLGAAEHHLKTALRINPFDPDIHCNLVTVLGRKAPREATLHAAICKSLSP